MLGSSVCTMRGPCFLLRVRSGLSDQGRDCTICGCTAPQRLKMVVSRDSPKGGLITR